MSKMDKASGDAAALPQVMVGATANHPTPDRYDGGSKHFGVRRALDGSRVNGVETGYADNVLCAACASTSCNCLMDSDY